MLYSRSLRRVFQSTLPVWGGTKLCKLRIVKILISIHPPREGRDFSGYEFRGLQNSFQSTLPVGGGT